MPLKFLDASNEELAKHHFRISQGEIVRSAVAEELILDDNLAIVPEVIPVLTDLAGNLREDLYGHHDKIQQSIKFPLVAGCFVYSSAKGAETAFHWNASPNGQVTISYLFEDALRGAAGADVTDEFAQTISVGMQSAYNVFVDFQNNVITNPKFDFKKGGRPLADIIGCGFYWASRIGLDFGMHHLGFD